MEYTVKKLAKLAGVSSRTLRYYDEIGILKPARINSSGYRIYGKTEVDMLQQILFYRELGINLKNIKDILTSPSFDKLCALNSHHKKLLEKRNQLDILISNVEKTIASTEGRVKIMDREKFQGFKKKMVDDNENKFGKEIRGKYGNHEIEKSNSKIMNMTKEQYYELMKIEEEFKKTLSKAFKTHDPASDIAQKSAKLHKKWLTYYWPEYTKEAHASLAKMYVSDERFTSYYDKEQPGTAKFLRDTILIYTDMKK
ncbi:MerR family transcriptional regulator [Clostridium tetani]|uniref:MerR family transcriptional regulator n=2 Tax=Clostridium tetani TaxID=1513 RepID=UPI000513D133|nr:MerR family transcriptional regulator [Clostridium tetani]AVP53626.1 MerR family transcriptional regulator [Clostridium tetani]KGI40238.1 MerR family transcriptional regulator [Clostridium tetani ATCC 9441]KGI42812.1 MerR family transcriptional regulator [Clostridium tetani]KHO33555.1 MerR family transcriptional regulator [Clostridium tetani]RXI46757.1 MerR family transcriptional regulator [Clostridium tetani]